MAARLIDQLLVGIGFRSDTSGLDRVVRKMRDVDRQVTHIARGLDRALGAALAICEGRRDNVPPGRLKS